MTLVWNKAEGKMEMRNAPPPLPTAWFVYEQKRPENGRVVRGQTAVHAHQAAALMGADGTRLIFHQTRSIILEDLLNELVLIVLSMYGKEATQ